MFLLVLRLLAVYAGTCALVLLLVRRFVRRIRPSVALLLALGPLVLTGKATFTAGVYAPLDIAYQAHPLAARSEELGIRGTQSPILGDVVSQFIPFRKSVRDAVKNGRLPLWNRFILAGEPLLANTQPAVLHPGTVIGFLLPLAQAWTFEMTLRHFLALLAMYLLLRELGCRELPSLLGAFGWALSDYLVFFAGWQHSAAAPPFPFLLLGLRRLSREPCGRNAALVVAALVLILSAGHPETLLFVVAAGGVYFLFELGFAGRGNRFRAVRWSLVAGVFALGLSAVLLLPLLEALPYTAEHTIRSAWYAHVDKSASVPESLRRSIQNVVPYAFGVSGHGRSVLGFGEPAGYVGAVMLPFAVLGLFAARREKWPLLVIAFLGLAMWARLPVVTDLVSALPLFDIGLNERMVLLAAFAISALAAFGAEHFLERKGFPLLFGALAALAVILLLYGDARPTLLRLEMDPGFLQGRLLAQVIPLALLAVAAGVGRRRAGAVVALSFLLLVVQRRFEAGGLYATFPNRAFYPALKVLDPIPRHEPYRFVATSFLFIPNIAALYELEDVRGYEAMTFRPLTETFPLWCVPQPVWYNRVDDVTRPFLSFLNVRWVLVPDDAPVPDGWKVRSDGDRTKLLENPRALPRAFVPQFVKRAATEDEERRTLLGMGDFAGYGVVGVSPTREWFRNGEATVSIEAYRPQSLVLSTEARAPTIVGTSIPRWPGWKIRIDGRPATGLSYNLAFVGFEVPPGRHRVELAYRPDGFVVGAAVTAATFLACVIAAVVIRRRRAREPR